MSLGVTRKAFLRAAAGMSGAVLLRPATQAFRNDLDAQGARPRATATVGNREFELIVTPAAGLTVKLVHKPSGTTLADSQYSYSFGAPTFSGAITGRKGNMFTVGVEGAAAGAIWVSQQFRVPAEQPWIEEQITLTNRGSYPLALPSARCGFALPVRIDSGVVSGPLKDFRFIALPFRREPLGDRGQYADYTLLQVLTEPRWSRLRSNHRIDRERSIVHSALAGTGLIQTEYPAYAAEGWLWVGEGIGFLISKYGQGGIEWAVLDRVPLESSRVGLRWGGFAIFQGDPERGAWLAPGQSHRFGVTRITAWKGELAEGFYAFRSEMESRGHGCPKGFNPPVHWNELYDNKLWWLGGRGQDDPENRSKYYRLEDMKLEAAKAKQYSCEALYLDPGWDTSFASKIWDESRLGKQSEFVELLGRQYGLSLSLHTPMSGWCNPSSYPREMDRMKRDGGRFSLSLCGASRQFRQETFARLDALARSGATFFMFDGTSYGGECWDPDHGHSLPAGREDHVRNLNRLARMVHAQHPRVLIEMHDQLLGGSTLRYLPIYYGHGPAPQPEEPKASGFDTVWAFELMWDPMVDLVGGHSIALYYYNLAYSLPLYIHIDLRKDNAQALMLWWNASTCRHLGIGGTHRDPEVQEAHKAAMAAYQHRKAFFTAGTFYGVDEMIHVHRHPTKPAAVMNCFNLEDHAVARQLSFEPARFGLDARQPYEFRSAPAQRIGDRYAVEVKIPAYGDVLVDVFGPDGSGSTGAFWAHASGWS